jgi:hypothetical protein
MAMANDKPASNWRNFAAWSALGATFYLLVMWGVFSVVSDDGLGAILQSRPVAALLGLGLIFSTVSVGFSNRKRPINLRALRNFVIRDAVAVALCMLVVWGFTALSGAGALGGMGASEWGAAVAGAALVILAVLGALATASVQAGADLIDDEMAAEEMRDRGRLLVYSFVWMAACGLLLILLALAGPAGLLPPAAALAGALALVAILAVLGIAVWRLTDELDRTLSYEAGNMAFYLILLLGGGWAMLAHLGFAAGPAPIAWLTLFTLAIFAASFIAVGRRKLLAR